MSIDFYIEEVQPTEVFHSNMTHNVVPMWKKAGIYDSVYNSEGRRAGDVAKELYGGFVHMKEEPEIFEKLNPSNGWGSYDTAVEFLEELISACNEHPDGVIRISK